MAHPRRRAIGCSHGSVAHLDDVTLTSARSIETYMSHCLAAGPSSSFGHPRRRGLIDTVYWPAAVQEIVTSTSICERFLDEHDNPDLRRRSSGVRGEASWRTPQQQIQSSHRLASVSGTCRQRPTV